MLLSCPDAFAQLQGTVQQLSFQGPITGSTVNFSIYLPQGYSTGSTRLPVIYHLHGIGGSSGGDQLSSVPRSYESARAAGLIGPAIIVFANGYGDSFWADSANSNKPAETNVVRELIPFIDANYRTLASRGGRVMQGFSMGGFGAKKFAAKFPELFSVSVSYDGALLPWSTIQTRHALQAAEIFSNSGTYFDQYSPWFWSQQNAGVLATDTAFRMIVGAIVNDNRAFRNHLLAQGISVEYVETGLPHTLGPILNAQGASSWAFIQQHLCLLAVDSSPANVVTCDSNPAGTSMSVAPTGTGPFSYQWQIQTSPPPDETWLTLTTAPISLPCGATSYATATPANASTVSIFVRNTCPSTPNAWPIRCVVSNACGSVTSNPAILTLLDSCCDSLDFNADSLFPDDADLLDFLSVLAGGNCSPGNTCSDIDFNNDGLFPDDNDLVSFLSVLAGGSCL